MQRMRVFCAFMFLTAVLFTLSSPARSVMWVGAEIGPNLMADADLELKSPGTSIRYEGASVNTSVVGGLTIGYHFVPEGFLGYSWPKWMKYFQVALDVSFHRLVWGKQTRPATINDNGTTIKTDATLDNINGQERVVVLGGGNVAIDCARSAVRLGRHVEMACLESGDKVPAHAWEVQAAQEEGIILHEGRTFERILSDERGHVRGIECMRVASFSFDESGRLNVEKVPNSTHVIECDTVIFSVGQRAGLAFIPDDAGVGLTGRKLIAVNPNTLAATREGVFAAGDSVSGTAFVIER